MNDLTKVQADCLAVVRCYVHTNGWAPTTDELAKQLRLGKTRIDVLLVDLCRKGYLVRGYGARCIRLTPKADETFRDELAGTLSTLDRAELEKFAAELVADNRRLRADLAAKSEAVHVQTTARRFESRRRAALELQLRRIQDSRFTTQDEERTQSLIVPRPSSVETDRREA